jgi:hypothetical protein
MLQNLQSVLYETELFKPLLLIRVQWQDKEVGYLWSPSEVLPSTFTLLGI